MLALPIDQFLDWMEYDKTSPIGDLRGDWQVASICSVLANIASQKGRGSKRFNAKDFLLEWSMDPRQSAPEHKKSWQEMKMWAQIIATASNADDKRRRR